MEFSVDTRTFRLGNGQWLFIQHFFYDHVDANHLQDVESGVQCVGRKGV